MLTAGPQEVVLRDLNKDLYMRHPTLRMFIALVTLGASAASCAHTHEGPLEKAGRKTDNAAHDVKEDIKH